MIKSKHKYNDNLCTTGEYSELEKIREFVKSRALNFGFADDVAHKIALAVDEACTNLIRHAYKFDNSKEICIHIEAGKNQFVVDILDDGAPFDPMSAEEPNMQEYFKSFHRGGLGIQIIKLVMDEITYIPSNISKSKNILKLKKVLS